MGYGALASSLSGDESKNRGGKKHRGGGKSAAAFSLAWQLTVILAVTTVALLGATLHYRSRYAHHKRHAHHTSTQQEKKLDDLHKHKTSIKEELDGKVKHVGFLEDRVAELQKELDNIKHDAKEADGRAKRREEARRGRMLNMIERVRKESHRATLDRFGPGPYQVEIQFELPADPKHHPNVPANPSLLINLYHQEMPHATHVFLEQVAHKLWDGCAFAVNADHVLQTAPVDAVTGQDRTPAFVEKELDILSFQEYSDRHPHKRYTVGFTGRPAGPGFYVNKIDNSVDNGPGGQAHHDLDEEADPCFGVVDDGSVLVLERLFQLPTIADNGPHDHWLEDYLPILSARVVGWVDPNDASATQAHLESDQHKMEDALKKAEIGQQQNAAATDTIDFRKMDDAVNKAEVGEQQTPIHATQAHVESEEHKMDDVSHNVFKKAEVTRQQTAATAENPGLVDLDIDAGL